jgi:dimethylglycine dehydrogenase
LTGALFDPHEGNLDPNGATHAYAGAAKKRGAEVILHNRVLSLRRLPGGEWSVETERGTITAEHVVNAAGLWARRVGNMVGIDHPLVPMPHHYLLTEEISEVAAIEGLMPAVTDLEGFTYLQREGNGVLLGLYEQNPRHWQVEGAPWDFGMTLFPEEIDRIMPELSIGFARFPALQDVGIRRWVNGAFTFTPDGNPLVGPVEGIPNYWAACGCMAGFSQCAGIGLVLANWIVDGDPGLDAFGMDVARFGPYASNDRYLRDTTAQFYARRFVMAYPNQQLPAGRPLKTTPCYDALAAAGARFSVNWGLEVPLYFAPNPEFEESDTLHRSNTE